MRPLSSFNCGIKYLLWKCKWKKFWVDQGTEFYNRLVPKWLDDNDIFIYSNHNEGNSVLAERAKFIKKRES